MTRNPARLVPPRLPPGSAVAVVAPASPPTDARKIDRGIAYLERRGFRVVRGSSLDLRDGYLSGDDASRAADLRNAFDDPAVGAVLCTRGGYGSARLLDRIDWTHVRRHPKIFVGFSDVTALSMAMVARAGLVTFAGPMVAAEMARGMDRFTERAFWPLLMHPRASRTLARVRPRAIRRGAAAAAEGVLLGGNLSVLVSLLGTPYEPRWDDCVLFLEDVGERVYRVDRMLGHLAHAGALGHARAVLLGEFSAVPASKPDRALDTVFDEYLAPLGIPVLAGIPFGHRPRKITLPLGARVRVDARRGTVSVMEAVVR